MKHLILLSLFTLHSSLFALSASLPQRWDVDLAEQSPQVFSLQRPRGETYELEAVLKRHGKPFEPAITNAFIYWQTNGMENLYWSAPASVSNNVLRATWLPSMDPGAATVRGYIGDPGHIYAAAFQFRFIASPGATPNELPLPQKVIDFAKVTVLNPPWSGGGGGGGGVDTNAVRDIVREQLATNGIRSVDGAARPLPKYLHLLDFDDSYPDAAEAYYVQRGSGVPAASCSSVRSGGFLYRNFDYPFDDRAEFVVRMSAGTVPAASSPRGVDEHRFASVGVAQVGTNLTERFVTSGKPSRWYKALPGATADGINENGVVCNINVVNGDPHEGGWPTNGTIHCLGAVRWVLDNATNAASAASVLATEVYFPSGWTQNFHYMVCDERETWIVENGEAYPVPSASSPTGAGRPTLTNFRLYPTRDTTGEGQERYDALTNGANITSQWWTLTYTASGYRASDLPGITGDDLTQLFSYWENNPRESHRGETFGDQSWWQSVHTSIYDITNRVLRVAVQENPDWYTFAVDQANVDLTPIETQLAALQDGKADKSTTYTKTETDSKIAEAVEANEKTGTAEQIVRGGYVSDLWDIDVYYANDAGQAYSAHDAEMDSQGNVIHTTYAAKTELDGKRDLTDNTCHKTEFGDWVAHDVPEGYEPYSSNPQPTWNDPHFPNQWSWFSRHNWYYLADGTPDSTELTFVSEDSEHQDKRFTATRSAVCTDGEKFVTDDVVDGKVSSAVSTNNPAFVSAVRAIAPTTIRTYDNIRQCWWVLEMVNGVPTWTVED